MKKFLLAALVGLTIVFASVQAQAAEPAQDTYVLTWEGTDYYVKAGTFDYSPSLGGAAPQFSCDVAHNGEVHHYKFVAKGLTALYIDGKNYGHSHSQHGPFIDAMYNAICIKLIHHM